MTAESTIAAARVGLDEIVGLRDDYRREMGCQIVHDSWHARGFLRHYALTSGGRVVGYGAVGGAPGDPQDTVKEFFVLPRDRGEALPLFRALVAAGGARTVEAQTNDVLLSLMLHDCARSITSETILFADGAATSLGPPSPDITFGPLTAADREAAFPHSVVPVGEWGLKVAGSVVATGGVLVHYNPPFGDLHMEVAPAWRRRGLGGYLVQELKRACYAMGRVPAARCHVTNVGSRRTLERAGMFPCARILRGELSEGCPPGVAS